MKLKRYKVNLGLHVSASSKKEALDLVKQIVESGTAVSKRSTFVSIKLPDPNIKSVEEVLF